MKNFKKIAIVLSGMILSSLSMANTKLIEERCWQTTSLTTHKTINVLFRLYENKGKWSVANVRYGSDRDVIPLVYKDTKEIEGVDGRPSHFRHYFNEVYQGKPNGKYTFDSQGANVWDFKYFPKSSSKPLLFQEKPIGEDSNECFAN